MKLDAQGRILHGRAGTILYGGNGTVLHAGRELPVFVEVWIEWGEGDVDVCGYFSRFPSETSGKVGWGWLSRATTPKSYADWKGDKTSGGPEHIWIGPRPEDGNRWLDYSSNGFRIHVNRYSADASMEVTVRAKDAFGHVLARTITPNGRFFSSANTGDPYVELFISNTGELTDIR